MIQPHDVFKSISSKYWLIFHLRFISRSQLWVLAYHVLIFNGSTLMSRIRRAVEKCYVSICLLTFIQGHSIEICRFLFSEKYPQIKQLMGYDWRIAVQVLVTVLIQLTIAYLVQDLSWKYVWLLTYVISGTLNHSLSISFHESKVIARKSKAFWENYFYCCLF